MFSYKESLIPANHEKFDRKTGHPPSIFSVFISDLFAFSLNVQVSTQSSRVSLSFFPPAIHKKENYDKIEMDSNRLVLVNIVQI